jgi:hypothetical protein
MPQPQTQYGTNPEGVQGGQCHFMNWHTGGLTGLIFFARIGLLMIKIDYIFKDIRIYLDVDVFSIRIYY